jgi:hypothetical protein
MFSNLQNKIDLKRIKEDTVEIDNEFIFKESFDIVNQTLLYFEKKKDKVNNISIKEEVVEYEDGEIFDFIEKSVEAEQKFIYNDNETLEDVKEMADEGVVETINESYLKYHKKKGILPQLMEDANNDLKLELDKYRMISGTVTDESISPLPDNNEYDVESLFDGVTLDIAKEAYLDHIHTMNWLEKQLVDYRKIINTSMSSGGSFQIDNGLKSLDVNDTDEIKNKIRDLNESVRFLKSKKI